MKRSPASILVVAQRGPAGRQRAEFLRRTLRPALGVRDELIVVADGEEAVSGLPVRGSVTDAYDLAARRIAAARLARHEFVVLVCADSVAPAHPLDGLIAALEAGAAAAGPLHDLGPGRQGVTAPLAALESPQAIKDWARTWRNAHQGERFDVDALGEGVLALRRSDLLADGGEPGLGRRLATRGTLTVVGDSVWHHRGAEGCGLEPRQVPLLSAVWIVKDEEEMLGASLASAAEVCDELVVYDTGSTDNTVQIARAAGARVVLGYWGDHFGDARNRALAHAQGVWHLQVDADEVVEVADAERLRRVLRQSGGESYTLDLENRTGSGLGVPYTAAIRRLARREESWFAGRLHEQVMHRTGRGPVQSFLEGIRIVHFGYMAARAEERDKGARNLRLASLALDDEVPAGLTAGSALADLARSQRFAGENEAVLATAARGLSETFLPLNWHQLCAAAATAAATLGRFDEAYGWIDRLAAAVTKQYAVSELRAEVLAAEGRYEQVLETVARIPLQAEDDNGRTVRRDGSLAFEVTALNALGRWSDAAARINEVTATGLLNLALEHVLAVFEKVPGALDTYAAALDRPMTMLTLAEARWVTPTRADALLEALWAVGRYPAGVLAAVGVLAPRLPVLRALEWSSRQRSAGVLDCALVRVAQDSGRSARDRVISAALAMEAFSDYRVMPALLEAAELIPDADADTVGDELRTVAPGVAASLLAA